MKVTILAIGTRMPDWVNEGANEYLRRMPRECRVEIVEIKLRQDADQQMLKKLSGSARVIALDERGQDWDTMKLSAQMQRWRDDGRDVVLLIGGPDGLSSECLQLAEARWSLSRLTLPHPLVRVVVAEQLYRAWTVLSGHPYHTGH